MRLLHTSDWHVGRTFHTHSTLENLVVVLDALVDMVRSEGVDAVLVAGDVFDSAMPSADAYEVLNRALRGIRAAGAEIVVTSGNHDSATRLGFQSDWARSAGVHVLTRPDRVAEPVVLDDEHGAVRIYGVPFLEPSLVRHLPAYAEARTHEQALRAALDAARDDLAGHPGRSVVIAHCFAADVAAADEASDVERDITAGGLDLVPTAVFSGFDYAALGHIHGRAVLGDGIRYSGAPLHYSFAEAGKPRGAFLVDLGPDGVEEVRFVELPVPRRLSVLTGELDDLLADRAHDDREGDWVKAVLTDRVRPLDAMRRLRTRFPHAVALEHRPSITAPGDAIGYASRVRTATDAEIVDAFLLHVRNGVGATPEESALLAEVLAEQAAAQVPA